MKIRLLTILLSLILLPAIAAIEVSTMQVSTHDIETVAQIDAAEQLDVCLTACCYVNWDRSSSGEGNMTCDSGGSTHCSSCCSSGICIGQQE